MQTSSWEFILLLFGSYLLGAIPAGYLAGRLLKGIDIRDYGSGNVGGSNVFHNVSRWAVVPVGVFDLSKGIIPAYLALHVFDFGYPGAVAASLCASIGHAWSIFLGFTGGRGLSTYLGMLLVVFPEGIILIGTFLFVGWVLGAFWTASVALLLLPVLSITMDKPIAVTLSTLAFILLSAIKRVEANRTPIPDGAERWQVIGRRLWYDRDIPSHDQWVRRKADKSD